MGMSVEPSSMALGADVRFRPPSRIGGRTDQRSSGPTSLVTFRAVVAMDTGDNLSMGSSSTYSAYSMTALTRADPCKCPITLIVTAMINRPIGVTVEACNGSPGHDHIIDRSKPGPHVDRTSRVVAQGTVIAVKRQDPFST